MDFKCSVRVQTAIEGIIYFTILIGVGLLLFAIWDFGNSEYNSFQLERTQAGSIQGKYIDSSGSAKSYYVTVRNGRYEADHEVSLVDYNAAKVGADFPIVPTDSDSVKTDEAQEQADNAQADSAKSQAAEADLYKRTKQAEAARIERQNASDAELYSAQKDAEGIKAKATAEAEATRLKGEADGASEKSRGEGIAAGVKAQAQAYNGMENPYLLANRYIDIMPQVAEQVAKPLTAVDSIKMYGSGNAQKLVKETTAIVDQVASGLKDSTGVDLPSLLSGLLVKSEMDADPAEGMTD